MTHCGCDAQITIGHRTVLSADSLNHCGQADFHHISVGTIVYGAQGGFAEIRRLTKSQNKTFVMRLESDVFLLILSRIPSPSDVSRVSRICRTLRPQAIEGLLRRSISILKKNPLCSFTQTAADAGHCAVLVKRLWLNPGKDLVVGEDTY